MDFSKFDSTLDAAQLDPRPRAKQAVREICEAMRDVPEKTRDALLSRLDGLALRIVVAVEHGNFSAVYELIGAFDTDLRGALRYERERGALKPWSAAAEVERIFAVPEQAAL
jgi:hypothetical protein